MYLYLSTLIARNVGFYLNRVFYPNGSTVLRTDIGVKKRALRCITNTTACCRDNVGYATHASNFFFPETGKVQSAVPPFERVTNGYYSNRLSKHIRLHRQPDGVITGQFKCIILQADLSSVAHLFISIGEKHLLFP